MNQQQAAPAAPFTDRARRMSLLARATRQELTACLEGRELMAGVHAVRGPETGLVMVRGRIGGGGNAFNLGEATVTRASIRLASGVIGHGQRLGTDHEAARLSAIIDALAEDGDGEGLCQTLLLTIERRLEAEAGRRDAETQATRVDFFTLVRGDD